MDKRFYKRAGILASILGASGVIFGAFGAHALKEKLSIQDLETLRTGVLYLFIHTLAALVISFAGLAQTTDRLLKVAAICFLTGVLLFSGSLFVISTATLTGFPKGIVGPVTPLGGLFFIGGWLFLLIWFLRQQK